MIFDHIRNLSVALQSHERERASFEAAWLAHAIVDGLTPAHHYPLEEKLTQLRGSDLSTRTSKRKKLIIPGSTKRQFVRNNWEFWGAKGVMTTHVHFELGVASAIATMRFDRFSFSDDIVRDLREHGFAHMFDRSLAHIAALDMYEEFAEKGWTRHLAKQTKDVLVPEIIRCVMLGWLAALYESEQHS